MNTENAGPLKGIRVAELTSVVLGPYACQMLGDLGADVIKIEPLDGDSNRKVGPYATTDSMRSFFLGCNRNKRSIALDIKSAEGYKAARAIINTCDVLVHNLRPAAISRLKLDYEQVKQSNENIIYCATYGYGSDGPYAGKGALDDSIQAACGLSALQSAQAGEPRFVPTVIADKATAMNVSQAVLAALFHRQRSGEGQAIEVPMFESMVAFVMTEHLWGQSFEPPQGTAGYPRLLAKHRRPYITADEKYIALLPYWDTHWSTFCELAGRLELITDPRFHNMQSRLEHIDECYRITGEIIKSKTQAKWLGLLENSNVPMMVVNSLEDLISDPQLCDSGFWQELDHPTEGRLRFAGSPFNFSKTPTSIRQMPPHLGEHSDEILREAGYAQATIAELKGQHIVNAAE